MADQLAGIDALPAQYGSLAAGFRSAAVELAHTSARRISQNVLPTNIYLRGAELKTHLYITQSGSRLLFGFLQRGAETHRIMDVTVNFRFDISERELPAVPLQAGSLIHTAIVPLFFLANPSDEEKRDAVKALGADLKEVFFIQMDAGILGVLRPESIRLSRMVWQKNPGAQWSRIDGNPGSPHSGRWQVLPFLALARTVGLWIKRGFESGAPARVHLPEETDESSEKTTLFTLRHLTEAWVQATNALRGPASNFDALAPIAERLQPEYETAGFDASVLLRLDSSGRLARKGSADDLFLLQAGVHIEEDEHQVARSTITLGPPDFLGGGSLYDAFLDCLEAPEPAQRLASQLGLKGQEAAIRSFLRSARSSPVDAPLVFRVKHGKPDTDVVTLHGTLNTLLQHVVLEAKFDVEAADPPSVCLRKGSLEVLYTDRPREGSPKPRGDEIVGYFLRLLTNLRNWQKALR